MHPHRNKGMDYLRQYAVVCAGLVPSYTYEFPQAPVLLSAYLTPGASQFSLPNTFGHIYAVIFM